MGITGIETSLKMFEKFLSSEGGVKIANKYSDDIIFGLDESQTIPLTQKLYPSGIYHIYIEILFNVESKVMINWKNQPNPKDMYNEIKPWLSIFGFPPTVEPIIINTKKNEDIPL